MPAYSRHSPCTDMASGKMAHVTAHTAERTRKAERVRRASSVGL